MAHHTSDPICPSCEAKLTQAHPDLAEWYRTRVKAKYPDGHISWSFRNELEQTWAYENGKSKCKWPKSRHNRTAPNGTPRAEALDLFKLGPSGQAMFPISWYKQVAEDVKAMGSPIEWGGNFKSIVDLDHFQLIESREPAPQTGGTPSSSIIS